jgi:hypothetical protein
MHAALPRISESFQNVMQFGAQQGGAPLGSLDLMGGTLLARGLAFVLESAFGLVLNEGFLDRGRKQKAEDFFEENFVIIDPSEPGGRRYYQGNFLITTRQQGDDMNVWLRFCPDTTRLFSERNGKRELDRKAVVDAQQLTEEEAVEIRDDRSKVDLIIEFRDLESILGIVRDGNADMVSLLLANLVQMRGNLGQLFKLGALAKNVELALDLPSIGH